MKKNRQIYLSWNSFNGGFVVAAKAIQLLSDNEKIIIDEIRYLHDKPLKDTAIAEKKAFLGEKTITELLKDTKVAEDDNIRKKIIDCHDIGELLYRNKKPTFENKLLHISNLTDYQSIYNAVINYIKITFPKDIDVDLHINVSPGTPQMHVVWLMLNSTGFLPSGTRLWSSQFIRNKNKTVLNPIDFKPHHYLSHVLKSGYGKVNSIQINPNETLSGKRKAAEYKIQLFTAIPDAPLLLLGERGVGKSTYVEKFIARDDLPFESLVCGIFSEELMRSELFGYEKGAFTGATSDKDGILSKFKSGGILFLDEIHDLSKPLQRQLMQVLQTGCFYPIGAKKPLLAKFKLVTASNLSIDALVGEKLDIDFFDRIARFIIEIPPLRKCKEDLELYWQKAWNEIGNFEEAPSLIWNETLKKYLNAQELYGNFRDLQKLISYIMAYYIGGNKKDLAIQKAIAEFEKWKSKKMEYPKSDKYFINNATYKEIVGVFNADLVTWAKEHYGGLDEAAKALGRSKSMLYVDMRNKTMM